MREIKFRGFIKDDEFGIMSYYVMPANEEYTKWMADLDGRGALDGDFVLGKDIEIMQYTGLTDKNGKEIYEGDILLGWDEIGYRQLLYKVIYDKDTTCFLAHNPNSYSRITKDEIRNRELHVTGNIYKS